MSVESPRQKVPPQGDADVPARLLGWYDRNARSLPWRAPPGAAPPDPYRTWLSEIMLQQTTVPVVIPYFEQFLARWPTVEALAAADTQELMAAWAGLGYYARARRLQLCARNVCLAGGFPQTAAGLGALPGIGPYTAAAIASIAFGEVVAVVDGNVERVVARLFAVADPPPALTRQARAILQPLVPSARPGDFAQAMMDLGALVCRPRSPQCSACPLADICEARRLGIADRLPARAERPARRVAQGTAWWIEVDGRVGLERRPSRGLLGDMPGLPGTDWRQDMDFALPFPGAWKRAAEPVRHSFTHLDLKLHVAAIRLSDRPAFPRDLAWAGAGELKGLPSLYRKVATRARALLED
ncbi:A/G-specific adenine glycosylase [Thermaurantiacus sp.]